MKIIKITEGFVTNSSSYSGTIIIAVRKGKELYTMLEKVGIPKDFASRFENIISSEVLERRNIFIEDLTDEYEILEASVLLAARGDDREGGAPEEGEDNELRWFIEEHDNTIEREELVQDNMILIYSRCEY